MSEYTDEKAILACLFPRGRFVEDEDGTCILKSRRRSQARDHLFIQSRGKLLGIFYGRGTGKRYLNRLLGHVVHHMKCDDEGILHVRWCQEAADLLPEFTLREPTYSGASPDHMREITRVRLGTTPESSPAPESTTTGGHDAQTVEVTT
jgi:hypothetical protein